MYICSLSKEKADGKEEEEIASKAFEEEEEEKRCITERAGSAEQILTQTKNAIAKIGRFTIAFARDITSRKEQFLSRRLMEE